MKGILTKLFTGSDNETWDLGRVLWAKLSVTYIGLSLWYYGSGHAFDPVAWSAGGACLLAGGAANLKIKQTTEPTNASAFDKPAG